LRALKTDSISAAARLIEQDSAKLTRAVNALLIGTTSFFRDAPVFEHLEESVIPGILGREKSPRVWSIACSDGAELCSVAMLFARGGPLPGSRFLGTDCREAALRTCRRGIYPADTAKEVPADLAEMFLIPNKNTVTVDPRLAGMIDWECRDILRDQDPGSWDMILCRNLAIYLDSTTIRRLWEQLSDALRPDGILVVGKAEKPHVSDLRRIAPCIYRKIPKANA
jgi:chemotaxis methyl-accepting protein methylase